MSELSSSMAVPWRSIFGFIARKVARATNMVKSSNVVDTYNASPTILSNPIDITKSPILSQILLKKNVFGVECKEPGLVIVRRTLDRPKRALTVDIVSRGIQQEFRGYVSGDNIFIVPGSFPPLNELPLLRTPRWAPSLLLAWRDARVQAMGTGRSGNDRIILQQPVRLLPYSEDPNAGRLEIEDGLVREPVRDEESDNGQNGRGEILGQAPVRVEEAAPSGEAHSTTPPRNEEEFQVENTREELVEQATSTLEDDGIPGPDVSLQEPEGAEHETLYLAGPARSQIWSDEDESLQESDVNTNEPGEAQHETSPSASPPASPTWSNDGASPEFGSADTLDDPQAGLEDSQSDNSSYQVSPVSRSSNSDDYWNLRPSPIEARSPAGASPSELRPSPAVSAICAASPEQPVASTNALASEGAQEDFQMSFKAGLYLAGDIFRGSDQPSKELLRQDGPSNGGIHSCYDVEVLMEIRRQELESQKQAEMAKIQQREAESETQIFGDRPLGKGRDVRRLGWSPTDTTRLEPPAIQIEDHHDVTSGVTRRHPETNIPTDYYKEEHLLRTEETLPARISTSADNFVTLHQSRPGSDTDGSSLPLPAITRKIASVDVRDALTDGMKPFPFSAVAAGKQPVGRSALEDVPRKEDILESHLADRHVDLQSSTSRVIHPAPPQLEPLAKISVFKKNDGILGSHLAHNAKIPVYKVGDISQEVPGEPKPANGGIGRVGALRELDTNSATRQRPEANDMNKKNSKPRKHVLRHIAKTNNLRDIAESNSQARNPASQLPPPAPKLRKAMLWRQEVTADFKAVEPPILDFKRLCRLPSRATSLKNAAASFETSSSTGTFMPKNEVDRFGLVPTEKEAREQKVQNDLSQESGRTNRISALVHGIAARTGCDFTKLANDAGFSVNPKVRVAERRIMNQSPGPTQPGSLLSPVTPGIEPNVGIAGRYIMDPSPCPIRPRGLPKPVAPQRYGKTKPWPRELNKPLKNHSRTAAILHQWRACDVYDGIPAPSPSSSLQQEDQHSSSGEEDGSRQGLGNHGLESPLTSDPEVASVYNPATGGAPEPSFLDKLSFPRTSSAGGEQPRPDNREYVHPDDDPEALLEHLDLAPPVYETIDGVTLLVGNDNYSDERYALRHPNSPIFTTKWVYDDTDFPCPKLRPATPPPREEDLYYATPKKSESSHSSSKELLAQDEPSNGRILSYDEIEAGMEVRRQQYKSEEQATLAEIQRLEAELAARISGDRRPGADVGAKRIETMR